jgi:hypothetical protein
MYNFQEKMPYTLEEEKALAIAPKITALFSIFGAGYIIVDVLRERKKLRETYHRLLLAMSASDLVASFLAFLGTWLAPAGTAGAFGAAGTTQTCIAQGFVINVCGALTPPLYNAGLSLYYVLLIRYGWKKEQIRKVEWCIHGIVWTLTLSTSIAALALDLFNFSGLSWCWISAFPLGCKESYSNDGESDCLLGDNASIYQRIFLYGPLWLCIAFATLATIMVYHKVLQQEKRMERYLVGDQLSRANRRTRRKTSRKVANQGLCYVGVFYLTWVWITIARLIEGSPPFAVAFLAVLFQPLQGFLNFLVYVRPRYLRYCDKNPDWSVMQLCVSTFCKTFNKQGQDASVDNATTLSTNDAPQCEVELVEPSDTQATNAPQCQVKLAEPDT